MEPLSLEPQDRGLYEPNDVWQGGHGAKRKRRQGDPEWAKELAASCGVYSNFEDRKRI